MKSFESVKEHSCGMSRRLKIMLKYKNEEIYKLEQELRTEAAAARIESKRADLMLKELIKLKRRIGRMTIKNGKTVKA